MLVPVTVYRWWFVLISEYNDALEICHEWYLPKVVFNIKLVKRWTLELIPFVPIHRHSLDRHSSPLYQEIVARGRNLHVFEDNYDRVFAHHTTLLVKRSIECIGVTHTFTLRLLHLLHPFRDFLCSLLNIVNPLTWIFALQIRVEVRSCRIRNEQEKFTSAWLALFKTSISSSWVLWGGSCQYCHSICFH